ncbi:unnamed protein product [Peronospora destructor]|uniref:SET domain-containing protein n=1 Tax=Peronospora destructor TaxID=86335 RepID=A0AAV0UU40_9STRA|nr:unnamed protein product [Peronospora destructor]
MATEARSSTGTLEDKPPWRTKAYVPEMWPLPREVAPAELKKEDFDTNAEYREAQHARSCLLWRAAFVKRAKKGRDRLGLRKTTRKKSHTKKMKRSGVTIIRGAGQAARPTVNGPGNRPDTGNDDKRGSDGDDGTNGEPGSPGNEVEGSVDDRAGDGEEELDEVIGLTQTDIGEKEAIPGTRRWLVNNVSVVQHVAWPMDVPLVIKIQNLSQISFDITGVREGKCGCVTWCEITQCANAAESQVCEETCSVGARMCQNRFRTCRLHLRVTRQGIGVFASKASSTTDRGVSILGCICPHPAPRGSVYHLPEPEGRRRAPSLVSADDGGSKARFVAHSCTLNTVYEEARGRRRVMVSLVSLFAIKTGEEITVDYTGNTGGPLWFHCHCPAHRAPLCSLV